jgi:hypothetical protein
MFCIVIPAHAGIHIYTEKMDTRLRGYDNEESDILRCPPFAAEDATASVKGQT